MIIKTILLFTVSCSVFASCNGQRNWPGYSSTNRSVLPGYLGDTVAATSKSIWVVFQDKQNNYWFGSDGQGVYRYDGKQMVHFASRDGLCNDHIREIKEDNSGNIYINTLNGISKFDGQRFTTLALTSDSKYWKLEQGDLWFTGARGGPYRYDGKTLHHLKFPKHYLEDDYYKQYPNSSIDPYDIYYIYKDRRGHIWFGTGALGIYHYDGKSIRWLYEEHLTLIKNGGSFGIRSILETSSGKFWFCNTKFRYQVLEGTSKELGKEFINYTREKGIDNITDPLGGDRIYYQSIAEDSKGNIWMQTYQGGIWKYNGQTLTHYPVKDGNENVNVISMYQDRTGGLWLATEAKGVYKLNGEVFEKFRM